MAFHVSKNSILSTLDPAYIEDGRQDIYEWSEKRRSKRLGVKGKFYHFQKLFIDKTVSELSNLNQFELKLNFGNYIIVCRPLLSYFVGDKNICAKSDGNRSSSNGPGRCV